jgi:hypothetical protein
LRKKEKKHVKPKKNEKKCGEKKQKNEQTEKKEEACGVGKATVLTPFRVLVNIDTRNLMDKILIFRFFTSYIYIYIYI